MKSTDIPAKFNAAFANAAASGSITAPVPATSSGNRAGLDLGFPPGTAAAGGFPYFQDFNGVLFQATGWARWLAAGAPVFYDATFSTAIGGYPKGAIVASTTTSKTWLSTVDNNTTDPDGGSPAGWFPMSSGRLIGIRSFQAATTYVCSPGTNFVVVEVQAPGGAGGGASTTNASQQSAAPGGSAGTYGKGLFLTGFNNVSIAPGGPGGGNPGANGGSGGGASFGALLTCPGGIGGGAPGANAPAGYGPGTAGPAGPGGSPGANLCYRVGGPGGPPVTLSLTLSPSGGQGGDSFLGAGGTANGVAAPPAGSGFGGGGAGAAIGTSASATPGGAGAPGIVIVHEYT